MSARAFRGGGICRHSSAFLNFVPRIGRALRDSLTSGEEFRLDPLIKEFHMPFADVSRQSPRYVVSLIDTGLSW